MTEQEKIHIKATEFANKCREEIVENRKNLGEKPLTHDELQVTWLNHYDGFVAGYIQRIMDFDELIKDRPRLTRFRSESGEDVLKWVRPSKMENIND